MRRIIDNFFAFGALSTLVLLLSAASINGARAQQLNCSLLIDNLESNITLSLKTAETLLSDLNAGAYPDGTLIGATGRPLLTNYTDLANRISDRVSLVIEDLNAMNQIGADCIAAGHFKTVIAQARSANNIDRYLHDKFTSADSEPSVFLTVSTARTLLSRAIGHKKNVLSALVAEGYFLQ